jgi:hypothetical protein
MSEGSLEEQAEDVPNNRTSQSRSTTMLSSMYPFIAAELEYRHQRDREDFQRIRLRRARRRSARLQRRAAAASSSSARHSVAATQH